MDQKYPLLFSPYRNKRGFIFKNRLIGAPLGVWGFAPGSGIETYVLEHYENQAKGGCSVVTVGDTPVDSHTPTGVAHLGLTENSNAIEFLAEFTKAMTEHGALANIELGYTGTPEGSGVDDVESQGFGVNSMSEEGLQDIARSFAEAAKVLKRANFPMCMLHFAHGKFFDKWLSPVQNQRTDGHGGSIENRIKFPVSVVRAVREAVGERFMIEIRLNGADPATEPERFETHVAFIKAIEDMIDLCHVSSRGDGFDSFLYSFPCYLQTPGMNVELAAALKKRVNVPIVTVGAITDAAMAEEILRSGKADFVAMARELIADPELPIKSMRGEEDDIRPCIGCHNCLTFMHSTNLFGCDINPRAGRGSRIPAQHTAAVRRKVVVVGGGPAGMQAAITAHDSGHEVVLMESSGALGGILKAFDDDPVKYRMRRYKEYLVRQVEKRGIDLRLNYEATPALLKAEGADTIIAAVGSQPIVPSVPGVDGKNVMTAIQAHAPGAEIGQNVVIVGGNLVGCEAALSMLEHGKNPVIIEMTGKIHADSDIPVSFIMDQRLSAGVKVMTNARCTAISETGVTVESSEGEQTIAADTVILAVGMRSNYDLAESFRGCAPIVRNIGDSLTVGTVRNASRTGFFAARDI